MEALRDRRFYNDRASALIVGLVGFTVQTVLQTLKSSQSFQLPC